MSLNICVITPQQVIWDALGDEVILPSPTGQIGILRGHVSLTTLIGIGVMKIRFQKTWIPFFVMGGLASVENDLVTVLLNKAERGDQIDQTLAKTALETAYQNLDEAQTQPEKVQARTALKCAKAREVAAVEFPQKIQFSLPPIVASSRSNQGMANLEMLNHF